MRASPRSIPSFALRGASVAVLALALTATLSACKRGEGADKAAKDKEKAEQTEAVPVEVAKVANRTMVASYTGTAALEARSQATVTARASGIIKRVYFDVGGVVRAGQPLAQLDSERTRLTLSQAQAQMNKLEANYRRAQQLVKDQMVSANDVDEIRFNLANARAQYEAAKLELSYAMVTAPISGVVSNRPALIKPGNLVQFGQDVATIVDTDRLEATLNVPEREIETMKVGQPVKLVVDALPGRVFNGTVDRIAPVVDAGSGTFRVICGFNSEGSLQPGMFGRMSIDYDQRRDVPSIPRQALLDDASDPAVYVVRANKAVRVPVKLGYTDGEFAEVREGLKVGEQVVIAGKSALREGGNVQVINAEAPAKKPAAAAPAVTAPAQR